MKRILFFILLFVMAGHVESQISTQVPVKRFSSLKEPTITSPTAGSVIDGPFVMVGKADPNATVSVSVKPDYKVIPRGDGRPTLLNGSKLFKQQDFTVTADAKGNWQSPLMEVKFSESTKNRQIFITCSQQLNSSSSLAKKYVYKGKELILTAIMATVQAPFAISSPKANAVVSSNMPISGTAKKGAVVHVMIYSGYFLQNDNGGPRKGNTQEYTVTAGDDGKWSTDAVNFNVNLQERITKTVYSIEATVQGTNDKKEIEVTQPKNTNADAASFTVSGPPNNSYQGANLFRVYGNASPGATIKVTVNYTGEETVDQHSGILFAKDISRTSISNKLYKEYLLKANVNGEWTTTQINGKNSTSSPSGVETIKRATTLFIKASQIDGNGVRLKSFDIMVITLPVK